MVSEPTRETRQRKKLAAVDSNSARRMRSVSSLTFTTDRMSFFVPTRSLLLPSPTAKPVNARREQKRGSHDAERTSSSDNPISLHALRQTEGCQRHGLFVNNDSDEDGKLVSELHLGGKAVDVQGRVDRLHLQTTLSPRIESEHFNSLFSFMYTEPRLHLSIRSPTTTPTRRFGEYPQSRSAWWDSC